MGIKTKDTNVMALTKLSKAVLAVVALCVLSVGIPVILTTVKVLVHGSVTTLTPLVVRKYEMASIQGESVDARETLIFAGFSKWSCEIGADFAPAHATRISSYFIQDGDVKLCGYTVAEANTAISTKSVCYVDKDFTYVLHVESNVTVVARFWVSCDVTEMWTVLVIVGFCCIAATVWGSLMCIIICKKKRT